MNKLKGFISKPHPAASIAKMLKMTRKQRHEFLKQESERLRIYFEREGKQIVKELME